MLFLKICIYKEFKIVFFFSPLQNVYFPAAKKTILYLLGTMKECKRDISDTILALCGGIQEEYGWLPPRSCEEDYFEDNRRSILDSIIHGEHLR